MQLRYRYAVIKQEVNDRSMMVRSLYPCSAKRMAGSITSENETFPDPNNLTVSIHAAAAPGTVTEFKFVSGILPRAPWFRTCSIVSALGARPDPFKAFTERSDEL